MGDGTVSSTYSYLANSPLVEQISFKQGNTPVMTTTRTFDRLNRLLAIGSTPSGSSATQFGYSYNAANQRTRRSEADASYWVYEYDSLGQVKSGKRYWQDGTLVAGQQFEYTHDDIGNRTATKAGGDENGLNLHAASYYRNLLNQYTSRDVLGGLDVMGAALPGLTVSVNTYAPYRKGEYFRKELAVGNSSVPVWQAITVVTNGQTAVTGNLWVPRTPEAFGYDLDGNLTSDGRWNYTWDAENRLVKMVANTSVGPQQRLDFAYDHQGRRITKRVWNNTAGTGALTVDQKFLYDGWNLVAELNATNNAVIRNYVWGLDLSGSLQGAGGVGGLLWLRDSSTLNNQPSTHFVSYDGNGNVLNLVNAADGKATAQYEYGPFGELIRATGPMAKANPIRWSTKYTDDETDLVMYHYRPYSSITGRFLSRDPLGDEAFFTFYTQGKTRFEQSQLQQEALKPLYSFVGNSPLGRVDPLGLSSYPRVGTAYQAKELFGHAAIEIDGTGYGFGPVDTSANSFWTPGTREGWGPESVGTPRHEWPQYINRGTDRSLWTGKALVPCRCATVADVKACAERVKKRYGHAHYSAIFRNCRDYVHDIQWECCLTGFSKGNYP